MTLIDALSILDKSRWVCLRNQRGEFITWDYAESFQDIIKNFVEIPEEYKLEVLSIQFDGETVVIVMLEGNKK